MALKLVQGNIFSTKCKVIVNTINCVGVMGAGIALECRLRYPEMFKIYQDLCNTKNIEIGTLWLYKSQEKWILNFPTKNHWKFPSKHLFLHKGLNAFLSFYKENNITSIAFPLLGADNGGLPKEESFDIMQKYLNDLPINIEVYHYDPNARDDFYDDFRSLILSLDIKDISIRSGLRENYIRKIVDAMKSDQITQLNQLTKVNGIGIKSLEKIFALRRITKRQMSLF